VRYVYGGKTVEASVKPAATSVNQWRESDPYVYSTLAGGTVGYLDYRSCADLSRFQTFAKTTFQTIKDQPVRALIIDIRQNGGGNDELNNVLWSYASNKPFKQNGGTIEKSCARLKSEYGKDRYTDIYGDEAWNAPDGTILQFGMNPNDNLIVPQTEPLRYNGPVYLLISTHTFSSAMSCALAAKDYGLATIVGEETGEPVNSTGETYEFTAPATGLRVSLTTKYYLAPKPHPDGQGVIPDVIVKTRPEDRAAGHDAVLQKALALSGYSSSST
jgi:C-terminal processing protease CtpA/Prc